jgi:Protein of unknown function (DUF3429)
MSQDNARRQPGFVRNPTRPRRLLSCRSNRIAIMPEKVSFQVTESPQTPLLGLVFGWIAMLPFVFGALASWALTDGSHAVAATVTWGGAILAFLAGVRRGLSFRTPGGEDSAQIATMLGLFLLALAALSTDSPVVSVVLLLIGYAAIAVLDPIAAARREAPLFFARLRPVQMLIPVGSLVAILWHLLRG